MQASLGFTPSTVISLDAEFGNGFRAIMNWVDMGDSPDHEKDYAQWRAYDNAGDLANPDCSHNIVNEDGPEQYMGIGLGYVIDDWTFAINIGHAPKTNRTRRKIPNREDSRSS